MAKEFRVILLDLQIINTFTSIVVYLVRAIVWSRTTRTRTLYTTTFQTDSIIFSVTMLLSIMRNLSLEIIPIRMKICVYTFDRLN